MKRNLPKKREWEDARRKIEDEGQCRNCGRNAYAARIEAAHTLGREHDEGKVCPECQGQALDKAHCERCNGWGYVLYVNPLDVIPLCGPATSTGTCHGRQHAHQLDLLPILTAAEQVRAVQVVGTIAGAYRALAGQLPQGAEQLDQAAAMPPRGMAHLEEGLGLYPATPMSPPPEE